MKKKQYTVRQNGRRGCYSAYSKYSGRYFSRCTTKAKASRQAKYIQNWYNRNFRMNYLP